MSIPKSIFQTWKSKTDVPKNFAYWSATFREQNPQYAHQLWDDADNRAFIAERFPWFLPRYDGFPAEIYRADAVRYFFLYEFGGIYADMDTECIKPLDPVLDAGDVVLGAMGPNLSMKHAIPNAVMLSMPRQEFWLLVMSLMLDAQGPQPEHVTGPIVLKQAHDLYVRDAKADAVRRRIDDVRARLSPLRQPQTQPSAVAVMAGNVFFPLDWTDRIHDTFFRRPMFERQLIPDRDTVTSLFPRSLTVSYWAHSW